MKAFEQYFPQCGAADYEVQGNSIFLSVQQRWLHQTLTISIPSPSNMLALLSHSDLFAPLA